MTNNYMRLYFFPAKGAGRHCLKKCLRESVFMIAWECGLKIIFNRLCYKKNTLRLFRRCSLFNEALVAKASAVLEKCFARHGSAATGYGLNRLGNAAYKICNPAG